jgi:hypothetical protein
MSLVRQTARIVEVKDSQHVPTALFVRWKYWMLYRFSAFATQSHPTVAKRQACARWCSECVSTIDECLVNGGVSSCL